MNRSIHGIKALVGERFGVTPEEMDSPIRTAGLVLARHVAMYLTRELTRFSLIEIGTRFGNRNHAGVMHAHKRIQFQLKNDPELSKAVTGIVAELETLGYRVTHEKPSAQITQ